MLARSRGHLRETATVDWVIFLLFLGAFLLVNIVLMRRCRFVLGGDDVAYFVSNCIAWALFTALNQVMLARCGASSRVYCYAFHLAKMGELTGMRAWESAAAFDGVLLAAIFASQIGMGPILREAEEELNNRYE